MRHLLKSVQSALNDGLLLEPGETAPPAPFVYVTALHSNAGLTRSLAGITLIAREMGFDREAETLYAADARSATYHAQHSEQPIALAVEVCPPRQTVSIAVSGPDNEEAYRLFLEADRRLFGNC